MSDYIVYKKTKCPYINVLDTPFVGVCTHCKGTGYVLEEVDLEDALLELVKTSAKARMILQYPTKFK